MRTYIQLINNYMMVYFLHISGWWFLATPLKNMTSSIGMIRNSQYFWENAKLMATKAPTRYSSRKSHLGSLDLHRRKPHLFHRPLDPLRWVGHLR